MEKHELIKYAYDNYHKKTKCKWLESIGVISCSGSYHFVNDNSNRIQDSNGYCIFDGEKWAEIIYEKEKQIIIPHTGGNVLVSKSAIIFDTPEKCFSGSYMVKIWEIYKSLQ